MLQAATSGAGGAAPALPAVTIENVSKSFGITRVLKDVSLQIQRGHIHALLGGNGSGKSTLIKLLAGIQPARGGSITVNGHHAAAQSVTPGWARSAGIACVHQDPGTFGDLTVAENLAAGGAYPTTTWGQISWRRTRRRAAEIIDRFGIRDATPDTLMSDLRQSDQTLVCIARAVMDFGGRHDGVLILDEPTSSLPPNEVDDLLTKLRQFAGQGQTILYVSHRLDEILRICDTASILRDGVHIDTVAVPGLTEEDLVSLILGRPPTQVYPSTEVRDAARPLLEVRHLQYGPLRDVNLDLFAGEILGVAGLLGSGRSELLNILFGALQPDAGSIHLRGEPTHFTSVRAAMRAGIALVPEERLHDAAFPDLSLRENLSAAGIMDYWNRWRLDHRRESADARRIMAQLPIRATSDRQPIGTLSGGNQQKAVLSRWLQREPEVLLLDEPTQGVDVGARAEIYSTVRECANRGAAVAVVTSDFEELAHGCDRVVVLSAGRIIAEAHAPHIHPDQLAVLCYDAGPPPEDVLAATTMTLEGDLADERH
jgi:ribose transport system ATP-binding protein